MDPNKHIKLVGLSVLESFGRLLGTPLQTFLSQYTWSGTQERAFLRKSQVMVTLLNQGPHFGNCYNRQNKELAGYPVLV